MRIRYLFMASIVCAVLGLIGLRYNHQHSLFLRNQILALDQGGQKVTENLEALRKFVFKHMNSSIRVELKYSYDRAVEEARQQTTNNQTGELYARAQRHCDQQGVSSVAQAECVQDYIESRLRPVDDPTTIDLPDKSRYIYAFVSPAWTPDLAGLGLLGAIIFMLAAIGLYIIKRLAAKARPTGHRSF